MSTSWSMLSKTPRVSAQDHLANEDYGEQSVSVVRRAQGRNSMQSPDTSMRGCGPIRDRERSILAVAPQGGSQPSLRVPTEARLCLALAVPTPPCLHHISSPRKSGRVGAAAATAICATLSALIVEAGDCATMANSSRRRSRSLGLLV